VQVIEAGEVAKAMATPEAAGTDEARDPAVEVA
jgi:hypothetical protein